MRWLVFAVLTTAAMAQAESAGLARFREAQQVLRDGDNTEANLRASIAGFDEAIKLGLTPAEQAESLAQKALALLRLGDLQKGEDAKKSTYEQGKNAAEAGVAADPKCADAHFYHGANMGRWGQTNGVLKSLFLLGDIKKEFQTTLAINPNHVDAMVALGLVDKEVPGMFGGSWERAEKAFRHALEIDPHFTRGMLDLAELLAQHDRKPEAIQWVLKVQNETAPSRPGEWRKFDRQKAQRLLAEWQKK